MQLLPNPGVPKITRLFLDCNLMFRVSQILLLHTVSVRQLEQFRHLLHIQQFTVFC